MALTMVIRRPVAVPVSILVQDAHADAPEVGFLPDAQLVLNEPCHRLSPEKHKPAASIPNHSGIFSLVGSGAC
jgi:hypothetical protein